MARSRKKLQRTNVSIFTITYNNHFHVHLKIVSPVDKEVYISFTKTNAHFDTMLFVKRLNFVLSIRSNFLILENGQQT